MSSVLPVVGAVGGFLIGGPQGAVIGYGLGMGVAGAFGGGKTVRLPDVEGPRLSDLRIQTSNYGKVIPEIFGTARLSGNVIWARPISEVRKETTTSSTQSGGKGGGGGRVTQTQTSVSYEYFVTMAIAVCKGPIDEIVRVWADAKVLDENFLQSGQGKYHVYLGTETQNPDTIMEGFEGVGKTPAFRGLAYVVIQDFPLAQFGNRIPNFTFEVKRSVRFQPAVEDKVKDIILIPGAGEFVYAPSIYTKQLGEDTAGGFVASSGKDPINMHNFNNVADVKLSLDQLQATFPNLEWVGLVVTWFATSTDAGACTIVPKVEFGTAGISIEPQDWSVAGLSRATAQQVLTFGDGKPTYGGTPSDKSVVDLCVEIKSRGLKVLFYPMIFVDQITPTPKPWRGRITPANLTDCNNWFTKTNGFNAFIRHYSQLQVGSVYLKNNIDAFVIGSELVGMTSYSNTTGNFPAVSQLASLAALVKADVGAAVKTTYAADWSEYHSTGGWFNMDPLWASSSIDFVGIDSYFPLTPDLPQTQITEAKIKEYWEKGEGWDYFYTDSVNRTGLTNYTDAKYAWKNLEYWWSNVHVNPNSVQTAWTSKMKEVWFTEFGFPSVDAAANQPNVFYDPTSSESFYPRASKGRVDFKAQREAINATLDYLQARNALSGKSGLVPRSFIWTWDARPFSFWPDLGNVWADAILWKTGHWINGKLGNSTLGAIVAKLLEKVGLSAGDYDVTRLTDTVDGFLVAQTITIREALEQLQSAYFFDCVESDGLLKFIKRGGQETATISDQDIIPNSKDGNVRDLVETIRKHELDLPQQVNVTYINRAAFFDPGTQLSQRQTVNAVNKVGLNLPVVMTDQQGKTIADVTLYNAWNERNNYKFNVGARYSTIEPTDIIIVSQNAVPTSMRVLSTRIERNGLTEVTAASEDVSTYDFYTPPGETPPVVEQGTVIPGTRLELIDIPPLPNDIDPVGIMRVAVTALGENWNGAVVYRSDDGGEAGGNNFNLLTSLVSQATLGGALTVLPAGPTHVFDVAGTVEVLLSSGTLSSTTELGVLNGANAALLGNEIIQFQTATLIGANRYRLSMLLRGRAGTEHEVGTHTLAERFVLLSSSVARIALQNNLIGLARWYKGVSVGDTLAVTPEQVFTYTGKTLKPFSPVMITGTRNLPAANDWTITWVRRTRVGGEWRDGVDVPLSEESERYEVEIMQGVTVKRTFTGITSPSVMYTAAQQVTDFGAVQSTLSVKIYQMSAVVGRGTPGIAMLT